MEKSQSQKKCVIVFDSGIGGLNILNACAAKYPQLDYVYAADNFNVPYGNISAEEVFGLSTGVLDGAMRFMPSAIVVACNTVTAECIDRLRERYAVPVIGMQPAVKEAAAYGGDCAVLVTRATAESANFNRLIEHNFSEARVYPCSGLADYIEKNILSLPENLPEGLVKIEGKPDSIVLGCTHYMYLSAQFRRAYGCRIFDGSEGTARRLGKILGISDHLNEKSGIGDHISEKNSQIVYFSGNINKNRRIYEQIFKNL